MITDELKLVGPRMTEGENKFQNGFVARDGCIYGKLRFHVKFVNFII